MSTIKINTGTGPTVAADLIGTANYQLVKMVVGASGAATRLALGQTAGAASLPVVVANDQTLSATIVGTPAVSVAGAPTVTATISNALLSITGTVDAAFAPSGTQDVAVVNTVTITGTVTTPASGTQSVAIVSGTVSTVLAMPTLVVTASANPLVITGTVTTPASGTQNVAIVGTPTVTASQGGVWNIGTVTTVLGTVAVSGGGGGVQYSVGETTIAATGTGTLMVGKQIGATTARGVVVHTTGGLIIADMPAVGGGAQYQVDTTTIGATGTGTLIVGVQQGATTARGLTIHTTGGLIVAQMPSVGGGVQYSVGDVTMEATGTGTLLIGKQVGATTARAVVVTTTGHLYVATVSTLLGTIAISGSASIINTPVVTATISNNPLIVTAANVTVASITTGSVSVVNTPVVTATISNNPLIVTAANITVASITTGSMSIINTPVITATISNSPLVCTASGVTIATGTVNIVGAVGTVSTVSTLLGVVAISGSMSVINTPVITATISNNPLVVTAANITVASITTGSMSIVNTPVITATISNNPLVVTAANITVASVTTGTFTAINVVQYTNAATVMAITAQGFVMMGMQSGATTGRSIAITTTGAVRTFIETGTMNVVNVISATGVLLGATTAVAGAFVATAHASNWDAYAVNTSTAAPAILRTSGAHTLYVTDLMVSVDVPGQFSLFSAATTKLVAYFATKGGMVMSLRSPMVLNSNQSLTFVLSTSGSCAAFAAGYTVT